MNSVIIELTGREKEILDEVAAKVEDEMASLAALGREQRLARFRDRVVGQLVLEGLQRLLWYIQVYEKRLDREQTERFGLQERRELVARQREWEQARQCVAEIDGLIQKSYEDHEQGAFQ